MTMRVFFLYLESNILIFVASQGSFQDRISEIQRAWWWCFNLEWYSIKTPLCFDPGSSKFEKFYLHPKNFSIHPIREIGCKNGLCVIWGV